MSEHAADPAAACRGAVLVLADGTAVAGRGVGARGRAVGEVCFNTAMTGYQEILTDPSYAGQIIAFTFPHIGNVGANPEDVEAARPAARGCVLRADVSAPSNWRATARLDSWLEAHGMPGIAGVDTRALTRRVRESGAQAGGGRARSGGAFRHRRAGRRGGRVARTRGHGPRARCHLP